MTEQRYAVTSETIKNGNILCDNNTIFLSEIYWT